MVLCCLLAGLFSLSGCGYLDSADKLIARAKSAYAKGDLSAAMIDLKSAIAKEPNAVESRLMLGRMYLDLGNGADAEKELRKAIELGAPPPTIQLIKARQLQGHHDEVIAASIDAEQKAAAGELRFSAEERADLAVLRGRSFMLIGRSEAALEAFEQSFQAVPNYPQALLGMVELALIERRLDDARSLVQKALGQDPTLATAWSLLADIERFGGNLQEAEAAVTKAIDLRAMNSADRVKRALIRTYRGDFKGAQSDLGTLKHWRNHASVRFAQGILFFRQQKYTQAQEQFELALKVDPDNLPAAFHLGVIFFMSNSLEQADAQVRRVYKARPDSSEAAILLAGIRSQMRDFRAAESILQRVLERNPNDIRALNLLSMNALSAGDYNAGVAYSRKVAELRPKSAVALFRLAASLTAAGKTDEAQRYFNTALDLDPKFRPAEEALVLMLIRDRQFDRAIDAAIKLKNDWPEHPKPLTLLGIAYLQKGDQGNARSALEGALKLAPGYPAAALTLSKLAADRGDLGNARRLLEDVVKTSPVNLAAQISLAELDAQEGKADSLHTRLEAAVRSHPQAVFPKIALARYYARTGNENRALSTLAEAKAKHPNSIEVDLELGDLQVRLKQYAEAAKTFQRLVEIAPSSADAHFKLAMTRNALGDRAGAAASLHKALEIDPANLEAARTSLWWLIAAGDIKAAEAQFSSLRDKLGKTEAHAINKWIGFLKTSLKQSDLRFRRALEKRPTASGAIILLAAAQWALGQNQEALGTLKEWLDLNPEDAAVQLGLAEAYLGLGQLNEAKAAYQRRAELRPESPVALNQLALLLRTSAPDKALKYAERARELAPERHEYAHTLGIVRLDRKEYKEAAAAFEAAVQLSSQNPTYRYYLALARARLGETGSSREILEALMARKQEFPEQDKAQNLLKQLRGAS
jgi:putative PEP-CTERM system TPR-repeat lipoprotein